MKTDKLFKEMLLVEIQANICHWITESYKKENI